MLPRRTCRNRPLNPAAQQLLYLLPISLLEFNLKSFASAHTSAILPEIAPGKRLYWLPIHAVIVLVKKIATTLHLASAARLRARPRGRAKAAQSSGATLRQFSFVFPCGIRSPYPIAAAAENDLCRVAIDTPRECAGSLRHRSPIHGDRIRRRGGQLDGGSSVGGDGEVIHSFSRTAPPAALHQPQRRLIACANPPDIAGDHRAQHQPLGALRGKIQIDAAESAIEPLFRVAEHEVVLRTGWIRIPCLGERGGALRKLVAVTRRIGALEHVKQYIGTPAIEQRIHQVVIA